MGNQTVDAEKQYRAAVYIRRSKDDRERRESIGSQRDLIYAFLRDKPEITVCSERIDDGYSGVSFKRPAMEEMLADIYAGKINCIVVKDLSRFGRNYIETGRYLEQIFPLLGVRFIAINDGYDSRSGESFLYQFLVPLKNLVNDAYSRDISIKVRSQLTVRCQRGDYIGPFPVYGYVRSETDRRRLAVDEKAAAVVQDIFYRKIAGYSCRQIAESLNEAGIPSPLEYKRLQGYRYSTSFQARPRALWSPQAVGRILGNEVYAGNTVQGKESTPNYKVKKRVKNPPAQWIRVENTHEAIIPLEDFLLVQNLLKKDTRIAPGQERRYLFSGKLTCKACGKNMVRRLSGRKGKKTAYYICRTHKAEPEKCPNACRVDEEELAFSIRTILGKLSAVFCGRPEAFSGKEGQRDGPGGLNHEMLAVFVEEIIAVNSKEILVRAAFCDEYQGDQNEDGGGKTAPWIGTGKLPRVPDYE